MLSDAYFMESMKRISELTEMLVKIIALENLMKDKNKLSILNDKIS